MKHKKIVQLLVCLFIISISLPISAVSEFPTKAIDSWGTIELEEGCYIEDGYVVIENTAGDGLSEEEYIQKIVRVRKLAKELYSQDSTRAVFESITQYSPVLDFQTFFRLNSDVWSATGNPGTFKYQRVTGFASLFPVNATGYVFVPNSGGSTFWFQNNNRDCVGRKVGRVIDINGNILYSSYTLQYTFNAG